MKLVQVKPVNKLRAEFYTRWSWWLLLLTFALTFLSPDRGDARNLYRLLVALPALAMLSTPVFKNLKEIQPVRWFAVLSLYLLLSIFWSGDIQSFDNHLLRVLAVWGLVLLLYYISVYRPEMFVRIDLAMVCFGLVWLVLIIADWRSLWKAKILYNISSISRGVFTHHLQVGWMLAVLSLLSLQRVFSKGSRPLLWSCVTLAFFITLLFAQARGGLLVFFAGVVAFCVVGQSYVKGRSIITLIGGLLLATGLSALLLPEMFLSLLERGASGRFLIWQNWYDLWQGDVVKLIFGHGLGASTENINFTNNALIAHYHNFYLNTYFYGGLVGIMLFFAWIFSVLRPKAMKTRDTLPWFPVLCGTLTGFLTDGDKLFNYPGAFTFCFILPAFCLVFAGQRPSANEEIQTD